LLSSRPRLIIQPSSWENTVGSSTLLYCTVLYNDGLTRRFRNCVSRTPREESHQYGLVVYAFHMHNPTHSCRNDHACLLLDGIDGRRALKTKGILKKNLVVGIIANKQAIEANLDGGPIVRVGEFIIWW
jgi:hypothetical protein